MSRVYREMEAGRRDSQDGSRLVYVLSQIAKILELTEIERRLIRLEERANGKLRGRLDRIEDVLGLSDVIVVVDQLHEDEDVEPKIAAAKRARGLDPEDRCLVVCIFEANC